MLKLYVIRQSRAYIYILYLHISIVSSALAYYVQPKHLYTMFAYNICKYSKLCSSLLRTA